MPLSLRLSGEILIQCVRMDKYQEEIEDNIRCLQKSRLVY